MATLSTSASTYDPALPEDHDSRRLIGRGRGLLAEIRTEPALRGEEELLELPRAIAGDDAIAVIMAAVDAYLASESSRPAVRRGCATWAEAGVLHDLRGSGPWPAGRTSWHEAELPR